ncbi:thiamine-phosphate kinase [Actinobacillus delphinicola]|uniref:Thiamine-monophosphate kinase n=1 Tax=Actinobacillus delphinicola TaxID=51161 RepID=A0A448TW39_9PAST|nr:thiamine-phosphate kinase [Actinobacillus delphinicola]MDG6896733.1 thiamine-phosphate kinase [Actinobacillus delphinicola]VEJ10165.1 thiamine-monophosphate kinase [Actinobacillus delphinicola]
MGEFDLITHYFKTQQNPQRPDVALSIGDDCAILNCPPSQQIAITTDTMVEGTHFLPTISPKDLAYKALATNLSDLAAMGARPAWISLALTLPEVDQDWLKDFSETFFEVLTKENVSLIGGDTTQGKLHCISITAQGLLPKGKALRRDKARVGDYIFVSGTLGDSAAGLALLLGQKNTELKNYDAPIFAENYVVARHLRPTPRIALGQYLLDHDFSQCALDISDGLMADLTHILERSHCHAELDIEKLPYSEELTQLFSLATCEKFALTGGEDYELCFTVPEAKIQDFKKAILSSDLPVPVSCIGRITDGAENKITLQRNGKVVDFTFTQGFDHFSK